MITQNDASGCPHRELAVGWALHALEPAEESLVADHLMGCTECTRIVSETEQVGAMLGLSSQQEAPSAELEQRILSAAAANAAAPVVSLVKPPKWTSRMTAGLPYRVLAAAASMILVMASVLLGIRIVQLDGERDQAQRQIAAMSAAMQRAADPSTDRVPLVTDDDRPMGVVFVSSRDVTLVPTDLPANRAEEQIYVLWGLSDDSATAQTPRALIGFDVGPDVPVPRVVPSAGDVGQFVGYAVSLEPGRQLPASPTTVMAKGQVDS